MPRFSRLLMVLLALALPNLALAQDPDRNTEFVRKLYGMLSATFTLGGNDIEPGKTVLIMANPGIVIDPALNSQIRADRMSVATLLNRVPAPRGAWHWDTSTKDLGQVYETVVDKKKLPTVTLTAAEKAALKEADAILYKNDGTASSKSDAYDKYQFDWMTATDALQQAQDKHYVDPTYNVPGALALAVQQAMNKWKLQGYKNEVETARAKHDELTQRDPAQWWGKLKNRLDASRVSDPVNPLNYFYDTQTTPTIFKAGSLGFSPYVFGKKDIEARTEDTRVSYGGSAGAGFGFWRISAGYAHSEVDLQKSSKLSDLSINMELARILIDRNWLDGLVFESRYWDWGSGSPYQGPISNGNAAALDGLAPLVPVGVLVARNVTIKGLDKDEIDKYFKETTDGGGSVGWGPFAVGGYYHREQTRTYFKGTYTDNSISITTPQIIGWYCLVLPKTPNPQPGLFPQP